jgi:hypothetical protein
LEHKEKIASIVAALLPWYGENARDLLEDGNRIAKFRIAYL